MGFLGAHHGISDKGSRPVDEVAETNLKNTDDKYTNYKCSQNCTHNFDQIHTHFPPSLNIVIFKPLKTDNMLCFSSFSA